MAEQVSSPEGQGTRWFDTGQWAMLSKTSTCVRAGRQLQSQLAPRSAARTRSVSWCNPWLRLRHPSGLPHPALGQPTLPRPLRSLPSSMRLPHGRWQSPSLQAMARTRSFAARHLVAAEAHRRRPPDPHHLDSEADVAQPAGASPPVPPHIYNRSVGTRPHGTV